MLTIYRDSEQTLHFARKSVVDGRLIPEVKPSPVYVPLKNHLQYAGYWAYPKAKAEGCHGCDAHLTACYSVELAVAAHYDMPQGCSAIGWHVRYDPLPAWENYRRVAAEQAFRKPAVYSLSVQELQLRTLTGTIAALRKLFLKTREGYKMRDLHPAVDYTLTTYGAPANLAVLIAEAPSVSEEDKEENLLRIAYTQALDKMKRGVRTVTKLGKYLRRHWPDLRDEEIRNIVARYESVKYEIWETQEQIIKAAEEGPHSCMKGKWRDLSEHPYNCYAVEYGWKVAVALKGDTITGRCLVNDNGWVRSYRAPEDNPNTSHHGGEHLGLEQWLEDNGYERLNGWEGYKLKADVPCEHNGYFTAPYLDGDCDRADILSGKYGEYFLISDDGRYWLESSDGNIEDRGSLETCEICDSTYYEDEGSYVRYLRSNTYRVREGNVCEDCLQNMTLVEGSEPEEYYVNDDRAERVQNSDRVIDSSYLPDDIYEIDGSYYTYYDVVYSEREGEYILLSESVRVGDDYAKQDNCMKCEHDDEWHLDEDMYTGKYDIAKDNLEDWLEDQDKEDAIEYLEALLNSQQIQQLKFDELKARFEAEAEDETSDETF